MVTDQYKKSKTVHFMKEENMTYLQLKNRYLILKKENKKKRIIRYSLWYKTFWTIINNKRKGFW